MGKRHGERPEATAPPEVFYDRAESRKYTGSSRVMDIQTRLTERALELLALPADGTPRLLLDLGGGSGLSGEAITEAGHTWVGFDISPAMLEVAQEREVNGDLCHHDLGDGLGLRPGAFDGAVSISAVQWLCNADRSSHNPRRRLKRFFESLYRCLARGARAVLQIYPETPQQAELITTCAMKAGFAGGLVVDYPNSTRAKKYYLVLMVGTAAYLPAPKLGAEGEAAEEVAVFDRKKSRKRGRDGGGKGGKDWILKKKEQRRLKGFSNVPQDTKYTGRKRSKARF